MPTEILVMCTRCGRPQAARKGGCVACGEALPDAPMPSASSASEAPFLLLEGAGRNVTGQDRRMTYRAAAASLPIVVELANLKSVALGRRRILEALLLVPLAWGLTFVFPSLWLVAGVLGVLAILVALLWQRYVLVLKTLDGHLLRWPLGLARLGSARAQRLEAAWSSGAQALASRGVAVHDVPRALDPGA